MGELRHGAPGTWMLVDGGLAIRAHGAGLPELLGSGARPLLGLTFGEASGCINAVVEQSRCGETTRCRYCALNRALLLTQQERRPVGPEVLQRSVWRGGRMVERAFGYVTAPSLEPPDHVLVRFGHVTAAGAVVRDVETGLA